MKKFLLILLFIVISNSLMAKEKNMKKLVVYFSKTGEQYSVGKIKRGNTAIVADIIAGVAGADVFEVKLQNDTYPTEYRALTEVASEERRKNIGPAIVGKIENFADYDVVFIGSPVWWSDMPMALYTFIEQYDWSGKTVAPFITHEGSGLAGIPDKIKMATGAIVTNGLAVYGHVAQNNPDEVKAKVETWLKAEKL